MLADSEILNLGNQGVISPFLTKQTNPASYDLRLDSEYRTPSLLVLHLDCQQVTPDHTDLHTMDDEGVVLDPGDFILASTMEFIRLPDDLAARVEGKSSIGRLGLAVHITAGFIDPGFQGDITLEIANLAPWSITLRPGQRIAQIAFTRMEGLVLSPYGVKGHYQGQRGPQESVFRA